MDNFVVLTNSLENTSTGSGGVGGDNNSNPGEKGNNPDRVTYPKTSKAQYKKEKLQRYRQKKAHNPAISSGSSSLWGAEWPAKEKEYNAYWKSIHDTKGNEK